MRRLITHTLLILCVCVVALFAFSNQQEVAVTLFPLPYELALPLYVLIPALFLGGYALGALSAWPAQVAARRRLRKEKKRSDQLEQEISRLRIETPASVPAKLS
jgi:uncharacterized integral membrane protein